jgi:hypothetical protein
VLVGEIALALGGLRGLAKCELDDSGLFSGRVETPR